VASAFYRDRRQHDDPMDFENVGFTSPAVLGSNLSYDAGKRVKR
jgi:hypothetical protein